MRPANRGARGMRLNAKLMDGKVVPVKVNEPPFGAPSPSIRWIKDEIKDELHLLPEMQQLYVSAQALCCWLVYCSILSKLLVNCSSRASCWMTSAQRPPT